MKKNNDFVPSWAKEVVWYQIFPERFRNGDLSNDPTRRTLKGSWPHDNHSPWQVHPWCSDWYELQPYEKLNGKNIWFNLQRRRYGGDIQGIIDKLDYLHDLGIGAIYLNPVFGAPSLHKYDGDTYHHIDPNFGPDPAGDRKLIRKETPDDPSAWIWTSADQLFLKLISEVHSRGMKIILDGVFNHMGINSWAFKDIIKHKNKSKYKNWFKVISFDYPRSKTRIKYKGWWGVKELPELNQDENGIVSAPREYIFQITKRWMDPNGDGDPSDGIDGWRLDVAACIEHQFWKDWRKHVKSINPEAYLTAEIVDPAEVLQPYLQGDQFDAVMNYNFYFACAEFFVHKKNKISVSEFDKKLKALRDAFPGCVTYAQQNLIGSHDTQRIGSLIVNRDLAAVRNWHNTFDVWKGKNPDYKTRKPNKEELRILKLIVTFQMAYVGAPYIYYGDEAGMWGANDPCCRKPMVWDDLSYEPEIHLPDQSLKKKIDAVKPNEKIFSHYKKLIKIRNSLKPLQLGSFKSLLLDDEKDIFVFERKFENQVVVTALNNGNSPQTVVLNLMSKGSYSDLLTGSSLTTRGNKLTFSLKRKEGRVFLLQN